MTDSFAAIGELERGHRAPLVFHRDLVTSEAVLQKSFVTISISAVLPQHIAVSLCLIVTALISFEAMPHLFCLPTGSYLR